MVAKKPSPFSEVEKAVSPSLRAVLAQLDEKMKDSLQEIRPVSYTHLDVYKRQPSCWMRGMWKN